MIKRRSLFRRDGILPVIVQKRRHCSGHCQEARHSSGYCQDARRSSGHCSEDFLTVIVRKGLCSSVNAQLQKRQCSSGHCSEGATFSFSHHCFTMDRNHQARTAGIAIALLLGVVRTPGRLMIDFPDPSIVVSSTGRVGSSVLNEARILGSNELAFEAVRSQFWVVDAKDLITDD